MIRRILAAVVAFFIVAFILIWMLGGGFADIKAAVNHYSDPLKSGSVIDWFFEIGSTTGEAFQLPDTPSSYPTLTIPNGTKGPSASTTVYMTGSSAPQGTQ